jgi:general secretion pathway protein G
MAKLPVSARSITYIACVCAVAFVWALVRLFVPTHVTRLRQAREETLRQDLFMMRAIVSQYVLDKQKRPHSLDDLVRAGYLKEIPKDPITGRNDTWILKCSNDSAEAGIEDIESDYGSQTSRKTARCD